MKPAWQRIDQFMSSALLLRAVRRGPFFAGVCLAALSASPAFAQDPAGEADSATNPATVEEQGAEIIVTATKRERTLQDTPVAVTVTTADRIEKAQIRDLKDLQSVVPSLRVGQLQSSANTNFFIRGFGNGANNAGIEPSVGVFVDGVYRSRTAAQIGDLPDLKRVEVLSGPQSTLFGKNASAGVISMVTAEPQFDLGGKVEASYGNYDAIVAKALVTGPLSDTIAFSLAGGYNERDGYVTNQVTGGKYNGRDRWLTRGQLLFKPSSDLKVRLIADYDEIDETCCAVVNLQSGTAAAAIQAPAPFGLGAKLSNPADRYDGKVYYNFDSTNKIKNYGFSGQVDYGFGNLNLTSITAWRKSHPITNQDSDFSSADLLSRNYQDLSIDTFTQELRLASDFDGPLNFLVGGFYFRERIDQTNQLLLGTQFRPYADLLIRGLSSNAFNLGQVEQLLGAAATGNPAAYVGKSFVAGTGFNEAYKLNDDSYSLFGQADWEITDKVTLTGGLNFTHDRKRFTTNNVSNEFFSAIPLGALVAPATNVLIAQNIGPFFGAPAASPTQIAAFRTAQPAAFAQIAAGSAAAAARLTDLSALQFLPPFVNVLNSVEPGRISDDNLSYTLRLAWEMNDHLNAYLSYATGYKPASVNLSRDSRPFAADQAALTSAGLTVNNLRYGTRYADAEKSRVAEFGLKGQWPEGFFNLAVFDQIIKGFQSNTFTGTGFALVNAGKESVFGAEFNGQIKPIENLALSLGATWLHPKYDSFVQSPFGDASGSKPAGIPEFSYTIGADYDLPVGAADTLNFHTDFHGESLVNVTEGLPGFVVRNSQTGALINAQPGIDAAKPFTRRVRDWNAAVTWQSHTGIELSVWGRNLLDNRYLLQIFDAPAQPGGINGYVSQPRTYGVTARYKF